MENNKKEKVLNLVLTSKNGKTYHLPVKYEKMVSGNVITVYRNGRQVREYCDNVQKIIEQGGMDIIMSLIKILEETDDGLIIIHHTPEYEIQISGL